MVQTFEGACLSNSRDAHEHVWAGRPCYGAQPPYSLLASGFCLLHYIRVFDVRSSGGVDAFMTNSSFVARRVDKAYRRTATPVFPPVDTEAYTLCTDKGDYYVTASRMVPYKRMDLIVQAFSRMPERRLYVVGE